jgi:phosphohistidine phosphatase
MDLLLWRHAEAEELADIKRAGASDLERALTPRGEKQALRVAAWLDRQLPEGARILTSPARRCEQTALALGRKFRLRPELAPGATAAQVLELVQWPLSKMPVLVIGHQPTLGQMISQLLGMHDSDCPVKKGAVWWLRTRERDGQMKAIVVAVQSPDVL